MSTKKYNSKTDWKRIKNMKDEDIDYSDIPELDKEFWDNAEVVIPNRYNPDYRVHPGEMLKETLKERNITLSELSNSCDLPMEYLEQIIQEKFDITENIALKLDKALGGAASLWINLQTDYNDARNNNANL